MLWIKAFHIIFMVTWFAGLFYLPRLFVYHAMDPDENVARQLAVMERRLFVMMTIGAVMTAIFGLLLLWKLGGIDAPHWRLGWWQAKLLGVAGLVAYHLACLRLMQRFAAGQNQRNHRWYRWFNELPSLLLILIVLLVVVRPF